MNTRPELKIASEKKLDAILELLVDVRAHQDYASLVLASKLYKDERPIENAFVSIYKEADQYSDDIINALNAKYGEKE